MAAAGTRCIPSLKASSGYCHDQNAKVSRLTITPALLVHCQSIFFAIFFIAQSSKKTEETPDSCNNVDEAQKHHTGQKKPDTKKYI